MEKSNPDKGGFLLDKRTKVKVITTIFCLIFSVFALYAFLFVADVSTGWRIVLVVIAIFWILSGILNLIEYFGPKK